MRRRSTFRETGASSALNWKRDLVVRLASETPKSRPLGDEAQRWRGLNGRSDGPALQRLNGCRETGQCNSS